MIDYLSLALEQDREEEGEPVPSLLRGLLAAGRPWYYRGGPVAAVPGPSPAEGPSRAGWEGQRRDAPMGEDVTREEERLSGDGLSQRIEEIGAEDLSFRVLPTRGGIGAPDIPLAERPDREAGWPLIWADPWEDGAERTAPLPAGRLSEEIRAYEALRREGWAAGERAPRTSAEGEAGRMAEREAGALPLLTALRRAGERAEFSRTQRRSFSLTLPETGSPAPAWGMEELDRAVERDARRYDGGFSLY